MSFPERLRTLIAEVCAGLPRDVHAELRARGVAFRWTREPSAPNPLAPYGALADCIDDEIRLYTQLLEQSDARIKSVIAHELAHALHRDYAVLCRHGDAARPLIEDLADLTAASWGYDPAPLRRQQ